MQAFWRKLRILFRRSRFDRELDEEMQAHLEMKTQELGDACRARREFGNVTLAREASRQTWGWSWLERLGQDLRYALRMLRKSPGFTAVAVLSLALGIGANTAIFSLLNALLLRLLPVADPQRLVQFVNSLPLWETGAGKWNGWFSYPQFEHFQAQSKTLAGIFGETGLGRVNVAFRGKPGVAYADACTASFFSVLGVKPQYGRFFAADEDRADAAVAVLSNDYWRSRFGADPTLIGGAVTINQTAFTVIGVTPPEFSDISVGGGPDLWVPLRTLDRLQPDQTRWREFFTSWLLIAGRLRPGVSREQAQAELDVIQRQALAEQLSVSELRNQENVQRFARENHLMLQSAARGAHSGLRERYAFPLMLLTGVAGIVLLVACANVANLLLARGSSRAREIGIRQALGASRGRLLRQLLTESLVLALIGGALAVPLAWWRGEAVVRVISGGDSPGLLDVRPDWRIFGFTAVVSLVTGVLFGLAPAVRSTRAAASPAMMEGGRQTGRSSHALNRVLVVAQVALSVVLITVAGLFVRTLQKLWSVNVGYDRENVLMFSVDAKLAGYPSDRADAVYREVLRRLQGLRGVRAASASVVRPVDDHFYLVDRVNEIDGRELPQRGVIRVEWNAVSPGYFLTVSTPMVLGRDFDL
ncbi:MAG: FtsX-like permease family protein, partial [Acidobacteria bacterium]|nr:FtsX-like permease family protein [Acidobacteriota bacterium]